MMKENMRPLILVTNDDSVHAKGIKALVEAVKPLGDVIVVGPDKAMSGMGHAITVNDPLRYRKSNNFGDVPAYAVSGTPVDCVKLGTRVIIDRQPDLIVSGINHGSNASVNIIYSGTMAAVLEGCLSGIPSIGFSLMNFSPDADFEPCIPFAREIVKNALEDRIPKGICLNVNFPSVPEGQINGVKVCRQSNASWKEVFDHRQDPHGRHYYWLTGEFVESDTVEGTDLGALKNNFVSVVPVHYDLTAHQYLNHFESWTEKLKVNED